MDITRRVLQSIAVVSIVLAVLIFGSALVAPKASAQTAEDIRVQIQELLAKVAELQAQLRQLGGQTTPPVLPNDMPPHRLCGLLNRNLGQGTRGDDVMSLQEFLRTEGYLNANATGYFGPATAQAVAKWQSAEGVSAVGSVGPVSRERIKIWCGMGNNRFGATPMRGPAPLAVTFKTNVQIANPQFVADAGDYKIVFGDGSEEKIPCTGSESFCAGPHTVTHTYTADGTYTAQLVHYGYFGPPSPEGGMPQQTVGRVQIHVGQIACTKEYKPVCGAKPVVCITSPCNPVPTTYGNRCTMEADGAKFLYEGQCRDTSPDPAKDPRCKAWYDGCNSCSRETPNSPAMCTLRACIAGQMTRPYCTAYFDDTGNKPPIISGFSGPTTLSVNQNGTWTVKASDPENGSLSYDINWGDENMTPAPSAASAREEFVQTTTFTHAYSAAGTYTVSIVVRDGAGKQARSLSTVRVGEPQPVACTMDAMQCPDGTWVGRTGPNCQFVCPASY